MRFRYVSGKNGVPEKKAIVYTREEHGINIDDVDADAVYLTSRLRMEGFESYIVGGAVRDLILGKKPKDFDIASEASPTQIKRLFRMARIIGKRFRLVHVHFGEKIIEVATFRSLQEGTTGNVFGTIDDDVKRRDFTCNALFYDPEAQIVVDYVGGVEDIREKRLRPVIPLDVIFSDDPVRMIRAVKYAAQSSFNLPLQLRRKIKKQGPLLQEISASRLTEEISKIISSSAAADIIEALDEMGLYQWLQPNAAKLLRSDSDFRRRYVGRFAAFRNSTPAFSRLLTALVQDYVEDNVNWKTLTAENYKEVFLLAREFVLPMNPPRFELDRGLRTLFAEKGIDVKHSYFADERSRRGGRGGRRGAKGAPEEDLALSQSAAVPAACDTAGSGEPEGEAKKRRRRRRKRRKSRVKEESASKASL